MLLFNLLLFFNHSEIAIRFYKLTSNHPILYPSQSLLSLQVLATVLSWFVFLNCFCARHLMCGCCCVSFEITKNRFHRYRCCRCRYWQRSACRSTRRLTRRFTTTRPAASSSTWPTCRCDASSRWQSTSRCSRPSTRRTRYLSSREAYLKCLY